jgi:hypothetical protein
MNTICQLIFEGVFSVDIKQEWTIAQETGTKKRPAQEPVFLNNILNSLIWQR